MRTVSGDGSLSLFDLLSGSVSGSVCSGKGSCGKCRVRFAGSAPAPSAKEKELLSASDISLGVRLACFCFPCGTFTVEDDSGPAYSAVVGFASSSAGEASDSSGYGASGYGAAVDLGTTTIALSLVDLRSGKQVAAVSLMNSQRRFGADVLSRIEKACAGGEGELQASAVRDIDAGLSLLIRKAGVPPGAVRRMVVAANTIMCHFLLGLPSCSLGRSPFAPHSLRFDPVPFSALASGIPGLSFAHAQFPVSVLPCADAFVGSDVIAGIAASGVLSGPLPALYIDLGTNAEMVLLDGRRIWCSSAAAGPAFEGAHVSCGCGSLPGAVSAVSIKGSRFAYERIPGGNGSSPGICGTGLMDFLACSLEAGLVRRDGSLARVCESSGIVLDPELPFRLTASDVRELQLALSAVRAGVSVLLDKAGLSRSAIARVYLAGGFGFHLSDRSAIRTGLLDASFAGKIAAPGNASLGGCVEYLRNSSLAGEIDAILAVCESVSLASEPGFNGYFIDSMEFPDQ